MIIVDSTVWIDYLNEIANPQTVWLIRNAYSGEIGLTDLILCEVLQGVRGDVRFQRTRTAFSRMPIIAGVDREVAVAAAQNYRTLRSKGITVRKMVDSLIATVCIERNHMLLHRDRDFDPFEEHLGLRVVHP